MTEKPYFLSKREWQVIQLLERLGLVWKVAQELGVNESTIQSQLSNIRKKVNSARSFRRKYGSIIKRKR
jgi:DNA-binding NarL/FixJ family response regulator